MQNQTFKLMMKTLLIIILFAAAATIPLVAGHMMIPGPCASIGYPDSCCPPGADCRVTVPGGICRCSADCHHNGDCCSDVSCSPKPRTCRDIGLQQCCDEDTVEEGGCIVYYNSGVTANNDGCSCALSCHQNSEHGCCPDAVQIGCVPQTCTEAGKEPGCCTGGPQNCRVSANGKTCYCDHKCVAFNDCCTDVPTVCAAHLMDSTKLVSQLRKELQMSRAEQQGCYTDTIKRRRD